MMEIENWVKKNKELYSAILSFLESESNPESEFEELKAIIDDQKIIEDKKSTQDIFQLLYKIGDNHHRTSDFFNRLGQIFEYLTQNSLPIKNTEIFDIYKSNKRLLLLLFEHNVITVDDSIVDLLKKNDEIIYYLFSEIKNFLDEESKQNIEKEINERFNESIETFESKCKQGENSLPICNLIRQDSIQEFISLINQTNLSLESLIESDFYESNIFLIENKPSLIEYACFYGSFQVIKYLKNNNVVFTSKIWLYAIHSNNPELIEFLEENEIEFRKEAAMESVKCHHNDIANYIKDNLLVFDKSLNEKIIREMNQSASISYNYSFFPDDVLSIISNPEKEKFKMCYLTYSFTEFIIPNSISLIGNFAFSGCSSLKKNYNSKFCNFNRSLRFF